MAARSSWWARVVASDGDVRAGSRMAVEVGGQPDGLGPQRRGDLADSTHGSGPVPPVGPVGTFGGPVSGGRGLLEDEVGVGAGDAEGGDAGPARVAVLRPGHGLGQQPDRAGGQSTCGVGSSTCRVWAAGRAAWP